MRLRDTSLSLRILGLALGSFLIILQVNHAVVANSYEESAIRSMGEQAAAFTAVADAAKGNQSALLRDGSLETSGLIAEAKQQMEAGKHYSETRFFRTIPVVVGWSAASDAAEREGIEFRIAAFDARNPANVPEPGSFRETLLQDLEAQLSQGGGDAIQRVNPETNQLHYMRGIALNGTCMTCHGQPKGKYDPDGDGLDPLGFAMEGWDPNGYHGAYEVVQSLESLEEQVASFQATALLYSIPMLGLVSLCFFYLLRRSFARPMGQLVASLRDIAEGDGDLSARLDASTRDEIGQVGLWFNQFLGKLDGIIREMLNGMEQIDLGADQVSNTSQQLASGATEQAASLEEIEAMVRETSQRTERSAVHAQEASDLSSKANDMANRGKEGVLEVNAAMDGVRQSTKEMAGVIKAIDSIAFQTNLLALNAAVEAARAGEAGQGFAVVAEEVRNLAQHSAEAARETAQMIQDSISRSEEATELSARVTEALGEIVLGTRDVDQLLTAIANESAEQSAGIVQITDTISGLGTVTQTGAGNSEELAAASEQTAAMVASLRQTLGAFKVS